MMALLDTMAREFLTAACSDFSRNWASDDPNATHIDPRLIGLSYEGEKLRLNEAPSYIIELMFGGDQRKKAIAMDVVAAGLSEGVFSAFISVCEGHIAEVDKKADGTADLSGYRYGDLQHRPDAHAAVIVCVYTLEKGTSIYVQQMVNGLPVGEPRVNHGAVGQMCVSKETMQ